MERSLTALDQLISEVTALDVKPPALAIKKLVLEGVELCNIQDALNKIYNIIKKNDVALKDVPDSMRPTDSSTPSQLAPPPKQHVDQSKKFEEVFVAYLDGKDLFEDWLEKNRLIATYVSGVGYNCFINSLLQHATGRYDVSQFDEDMIKYIKITAGIEKPDQIEMIYRDTKEAKKILQAINKLYQTNLRVHFIEIYNNGSYLESGCLLDDFASILSQDVIVWQQPNHYVAIASPSLFELLKIKKKHSEHIPRSKLSKDRNGLIVISTLPDGNCAFNAFALGLCDLILEHELEDRREFYLPFQAELNLSEPNLECFKKWIIENPDLAGRQRKLQKILRMIAINYIEENYQDVYLEVYQNQLWSAYENPKIDDTFKVHNHIETKFKEPKLSRAELIKWWEKTPPGTKSPKEIYFDCLRQPATMASEYARWGGSPELDALAVFFNINIWWEKFGAKSSLGVEGGIIRKINREDAILLRNLDIGDFLGSSFRINNFKDIQELESHMNPLPEDVQKKLLEFIAALPDTKITLPDAINDIKLSDIRSQLKIRGIINDKGFFINTFGVLEKKRIQQKLMGLTNPVLRARVIKTFKENPRTFGIRNSGGHWTYCQPEKYSKFSGKFNATQMLTRNIVLQLPDGKKHNFEEYNNLKKLIEGIRSKEGYFEEHTVENGILLITFKDTVPYSQKLQELLKQTTESVAKIQKGDDLHSKGREIQNQSAAMLDKFCEAWDEIIKSYKTIDFYFMKDQISGFLLFLVSNFYQNKALTKKYGFLSNLSFSDFILLGTIFKQNDMEAFNLPHYHLTLAAILEDILKEIIKAKDIYTMMVDIEAREKDPTFKNFKTEKFKINEALVDELIAKQKELDSKLDDKGQKLSNQKKKDILKNFSENKKILVQLERTEKFCSAIKSYESLTKIHAMIIELQEFSLKLKSPISLLEKEYVLNRLCLIGEYITSKHLSNVIKTRKPHIDWQKYIDFRDLVEHQVEKGCEHILTSMDFKQVIDDLVPLKIAISEILNEKQPEFFILDLSIEKKEPQKLSSSGIDKKILNQNLPAVETKRIAEFCEKNVVLPKDVSTLLDNRIKALENISSLLDDLLKLEWSKLTQFKTELCKILPKAISFQLTDIDELKKIGFDKGSLDIFVREFSNDFKSMKAEILYKVNDQKKDKKLFEKFEAIFILEHKQLTRIYAKVKDDIPILKKAQILQNELSNKEFQEKYNLWHLACDISFEDLDKVIEILNKYDCFEILKKHIISETVLSVENMRQIIAKLPKSEVLDYDFFVNALFRIAKQKPINIYLAKMKTAAQQLQSKKTVYTAEDKIEFALKYFRRISVLLHDRLHDDKFMDEVFSKLRIAETVGFSQGFSKLSESQNRLLKYFYDLSNHQDFSSLPKALLKKMCRKYVSSGIYDKIEAEKFSTMASVQPEIIDKYRETYAEKVPEILSQDILFKNSLQYNMKQAILWLHDISQVPLFQKTVYLRNNYQDLIEHRNFLAHDDDHFLKTLTAEEWFHIYKIGENIDILRIELERLVSEIQHQSDKFSPQFKELKNKKGYHKKSKISRETKAFSAFR